MKNKALRLKISWLPNEIDLFKNKDEQLKPNEESLETKNQSYKLKLKILCYNFEIYRNHCICCLVNKNKPLPNLELGDKNSEIILLKPNPLSYEACF